MKRAPIAWALALTLWGSLHPVLSAKTLEADICVFGGTSAGVIAAVQTARMKQSVLLLEPGRHLGGLTAGGLGWTDIGNKDAIGGLSLQFYQRLGRHYGKPEAWTFEPSVAEREYHALLAEHQITPRFEQRLKAVKMKGSRIKEIVLEDGTKVRAGMFIDATYEGDLMAKAGVPYHIGREANATYGETLNGIRDATPYHQFLVPVDPYVKTGQPSSGLLPLIQEVPFGQAGDGDACVQAYNFRLCLTQNPANRRPILAPPGYDPVRYELLGRYFDALQAANKPVSLKTFIKIDMVTPDKTDINNNGAFSTDYIGMNYAYPEADYAARERIREDHLRYIQGFLHYLATSPRVPEAIRAEMQPWGLCKDEFPDTGGWPHQMYVREARRMIGALVMTEKHCRTLESVNDPIGLAAYTMDSHNCRRVARNGAVENEGDVQIPPMSPYGVSYRALIPPAGKADNLLVPICMSASHIAYGSIRMEPVFMIFGQSAATAAVLALQARTSVHQVDYAKLRARLLADGQILDWTPPPVSPEIAAARAALKGIVVDDMDALKTGSWMRGGSAERNLVGPGYAHDGDTAKGSASITFVPDLPAAGTYAIVLIAPPHPNRADKVPVTISVTGQEPRTVQVNLKPPGNKGTIPLGRHPLPKGRQTRVTISNQDTTGYVAVDGMLFAPVP